MDPVTHKFSWMRFADNAFPNWNEHPDGDPGHISPVQQDMFYSYQLAGGSKPGKSPLSWDEGSIVASGILDKINNHMSAQAYRALKKHGVLNPASQVDTMKITKHFNKELSMIPAWRQKQMVDLLFWWEEESHRLRKLLEEQTELEQLLERAKRDGGVQEAKSYRMLLERVRGKINTKPSERVVAVEEDRDEVFKEATALLQAPSDTHDAHPTGVASRGGAGEDLPGYSA